MKNRLLLVICTLGLFACVHAQPCTPAGNETTYGTSDVWIGYVYDNSNLSNYAGYMNAGAAGNPNFDINFGGDGVNYATNGCPVFTETFSVRYKLTKTMTAGTYEFVVGGDDGYRLSLDGGATWVINHWVDQSYNTTGTTVTLGAGTYNMVLEYYENGGSNRISFSMTQTCMGSDDQSMYGTGNVWRGYVYDGIAFNTFKGTVLKGTAGNAYFDENFGGDNVTYNTNACPVQTETFSVRYRLRKTFNNVTAVFLVGADDGYRLSLNGGSSWIISNWGDHGFATSSYTINLNGTYDMVLEFYENGGSNRLLFDVSTTVLPVQLLSFNGEMKNNKVNLQFSSTLSSNAHHFTIERSVDGKSWIAVDDVKANETAQYRYTDASPLSGISYYRLKMTDNDGMITYSGIVTIKGASITALKIYPTVVQPQSSLFLHSDRVIDHAMLTITDLTGRQLWQQPLNNLVTNQLIQLSLPANRLAKGLYLVQLKGNNDLLLNQKLIVE